MTQEQKELLTYIHYILEMDINDKSKSYEHTLEEAGKIETLEVSREQHLEEVMRWTAQQLENHFELVLEQEID